MKTIKEEVTSTVYDGWPTGATKAIEKLEKHIDTARKLVKLYIASGNAIYLEKALEDDLSGAYFDVDLTETIKQQSEANTKKLKTVDL